MVNYKTEILGSLSSVTESTTIILYDRNQFTGRISIYNINSFYESLLGTGEYQKITRSSSQVDFEYIPGTLKSGFNVIIFLNPDTQTPSGYCEFINTQGRDLILKIKIGYSGELSEVITDTPFKNNILVALNSVVTNKQVVGNLPYEFTSVKDVLSENHENLYTDNILRVLSEPTSVISLGYGVVTRDGLSLLNLQRDIYINPYPECYTRFTSYAITYFMNDVVVYGWNENGEYSICSLSRTNKYGTQIYYTIGYSSSIDDFNIETLPAEASSIKYISGKYIFTENGIYDVYEKTYIPEKNKFADPYDPESKLYEIKQLGTVDEVLNEYPEISETYLNLSEYLRYYKFEAIRKIGSWFILRQGETNLYLAVSTGMILYMTPEDLERAFFLNNQSVLIHEDTYYTLYNTLHRKYYTERARLASEGGTMINYYDYYLDSSGIFQPLIYQDENYLGVCSSPVISKNKEYNQYYQDEEIKVIQKTNELYTTPLNDYRRGSYILKGKGIPNFCNTFEGLLFWVDTYKLYYL